MRADVQINVYLKFTRNPGCRTYQLEKRHWAVQPLRSGWLFPQRTISSPMVLNTSYNVNTDDYYYDYHYYYDVCYAFHETTLKELCERL